MVGCILSVGVHNAVDSRIDMCVAHSSGDIGSDRFAILALRARRNLVLRGAGIPVIISICLVVFSRSTNICVRQ